MKRSVVFISFVLFITPGRVFCSRCKESEDLKVDQCAQKLFLFGDRSAKGFPETDQGLQKYCDYARETEKCIKDYSRRCLAAFPRQVTNLIVFGISNQQRKFCRKDAKPIVQHGKCGNLGLEHGHRCMDTYIDHLYGIKTAEKSKKIPYVCCSFFKFKKCVLSDLRRQKSNCSAESVKFYGELIHGIAADVLELICVEHKENSDACKSMVKGLPKGKPNTKRSKSILPPFTAIFETL